MKCLLLLFKVTSVFCIVENIVFHRRPILRHSNNEVDLKEVTNYNIESLKIGFWLYTRSNPTVYQTLKYGDTNLLLTSYYNGTKSTIFVAHGWGGNGENELSKTLEDAFLYDGDVNVIVIDWSHTASKDYFTAKMSVHAIGKILGTFIQWLTTFEVSYDKIHLVGFSLGGHLVGIAGRYTEHPVKRITALDPAGPLWVSDKNRLNKNDAQYVEVIHTNAGFLGLAQPCGHADFYPNGGMRMPGCWHNTCSHSKSYKYMAETVKHNTFHARQCDTLDDVKEDKCKGEFYAMGNSDLNKFREGLFRVNVR